MIERTSFIVLNKYMQDWGCSSASRRWRDCYKRWPLSGIKRDAGRVEVSNAADMKRGFDLLRECELGLKITGATTRARIVPPSPPTHTPQPLWIIQFRKTLLACNLLSLTTL